MIIDWADKSDPRVPRENELAMKEFLMNESARLTLKPGTIWQRMKDGKYPQINVRRVNRRIVYVSQTKS